MLRRNRPRVTGTIAGVTAAALITLLTFVVGMLLPGAASAAAYPPPVCATVSVSTTHPHAGEAITVSGTGFTAGQTVTIQIESTPRDVGTATIKNDGTFSTQITVPSDMSGPHQLLVVGGTPTCPIGPIDIVITGPSQSPSSSIGGETVGPGGGGLSETGVQIALLLAIGGLALVAGVGLTRVGRGKRASH